MQAEEYGIVTVLFMVIMGAFKLMEKLIVSAKPKSMDAANMINIQKTIEQTNKILAKHIDEDDENHKALLSKVMQIKNDTESLRTQHSHTDSEGVPMWYTPRRWGRLLEELIIQVGKIAQILDKHLNKP